MPRWLSWGNFFHCSLNFTHQISSVIPQTLPKTLALLAKCSPALLPSHLLWLESFPSHTQWWFLMPHPCRAERRRQIREQSLMNTRVQERSCQIGQTLQAIGSQPLRCFKVMSGLVKTDFWAPFSKVSDYKILIVPRA